jgi:hypothetical protein
VPKEKDQSNEQSKSFTVGSAPGAASKSKGASKSAGAKTKAVKVEIRESVFPILTSFRRGGGKDTKAFQAEMQRVLLAASEVAKNGSEGEKRDAEQVQKAYALSLAILENSKIVR